MKKLLILLLAAVLSTCGDSTNNDIDIPCKDTDCKDYFSQSSAQAAFNADRNCRNDLDQDKDGTACEEPGNEVSSSGSGSGSSGSGSSGGCPTTSACGCSGKNKTPCQNDPCCKWTTGKGCGCK